MSCRLARLYRRTENVRILAVVVSELELIDVERKIFLGHFMERTNDAPLNDTPESFNGVRVNRAAYILIAAVMDNAEWIFTPKVVIALVFVCGKQTNLVGHHFAHERSECDCVGIVDYPRNYVALALDCADHDSFTCSASSTHAATPTWAFVFVPGLAAHKGFVHFDVADQLLELLITERSADLMAHEPRGLVGTESHVPHDLQCANPLLAGEHQVHDAEPLSQRLVRVFEDRIDQHGKTVAGIWSAVIALPVKVFGAVRLGLKAAARTAYNAIGPAVVHQVLLAGVLVRKLLLEIRHTHLVDSVMRGLYLLGHGQSPIGLGALNHG